MSGYETAYNLLMEMEMIYIEHEKHSIQILESPAPEIIVSKENKDRVSFEFTKSGGLLLIHIDLLPPSQFICLI